MLRSRLFWKVTLALTALILVSAAALQVVNRVRHRFSPDSLRVIADLCLLAPWVYFVLA